MVRTISKLLDIFEARGLLTAPAHAPSASADVLEKPSDDRAWIVRELLDTERKYVQDLEVMQNYARALGQHDILPPDTIHALFGNLNTLVDVNRRFLICVEENARRPADEQHFGHVFQTMVRGAGASCTRTAAHAMRPSRRRATSRCTSRSAQTTRRRWTSSLPRHTTSQCVLPLRLLLCTC